MKTFDQKQLIQIVLYVLEKTGGVGYYQLFKILYFADSNHLAKWGTRIISDDFYALECGPVPTELYDAIKDLKTLRTDLGKLLGESVFLSDGKSPNVLLPKYPANQDYISKSTKEALDQSIEENAKSSFGVLKSKSHDIAWIEASKSLGKKIMSPVTMAKAYGADDNTIDYIKEQLDIDLALA